MVNHGKYFLLVVAFFFIGSLSVYSYADIAYGSESSGIGRDVGWYPPEFSRNIRNNWRGIIISGLAKPNDVITIDRRILRIGPAGQQGSVGLRRDMLDGVPARANRRGEFEFEVFLPPGKFTLRARVRGEEETEASRVYFLQLEVEKDRVRFTFNENFTLLPRVDVFRPNNSVLVGLGANYFKYLKHWNSKENRAEFESFYWPFGQMGYYKNLTDRWEFRADVKRAPGKTASGENFEIKDGDFAWLLGTGNAIFGQNWGYTLWERYRLELRIPFGIQYQMIPFLRTSENSVSELELVNNSLIMIMLGFHFDLYSMGNWQYEMFMRYHYPVSHGDAFDLESSVSFDGSVGVRYNFPSRRYGLGLYWYGQSTNLSLKETDQFSQDKFSSTFKLFYSNLELRGSFYW